MSVDMTDYLKALELAGVEPRIAQAHADALKRLLEQTFPITAPRADFLQALGQPVFPYTSNLYNVLCSVTQNVVLGQGVYFFLNHNWGSLAFNLNTLVIRSAVAILIISIIWHRYVIHNHFVAWLPRPFDTIILFGLAVAQSAMIYAAVTSVDENIFAWLLVLIAVTGLWAYLHTRRTFKNENIVPVLLDTHFGPIIGPRVRVSN